MTIKKERNWSLELLEVNAESSNRDICDLNFEIVRISRGIFAMNGFIDFKIDVDDNALFEGFLYRSSTVRNEFRKLPMEMCNETLTETVNTFYKTYLMNDIQECATNMPYLEEEFVAPLTKRYVEIRNCTISNDSLPSHMAEGLYRLLIKVHGSIEVVFEVYFRIEED
ncbi:hypothetical protein FF38_11189 [Lucilia cuprina]|uniref:Uncharacterized protein n=1 Tax=Lucilia cuprina TaxID=7375 RepID=A0A0L0C734_LUCCU|nr:hypothetical protein FF38_11189 [Lucilia cuprina]